MNKYFYDKCIFLEKWSLKCYCSMIRGQEDRQFPVLFRFRIRQTDLFREKRKKIGPKINLFLVEYLIKILKVI